MAASILFSSVYGDVLMEEVSKGRVVSGTGTFGFDETELVLVLFDNLVIGEYDEEKDCVRSDVSRG